MKIVPFLISYGQRDQYNKTIFHLYNVDEETVQHLFFNCKTTISVWNMCRRWVGIQSSLHNESKGHFHQLYLFQITSNENDIWRGL